MKTAKLFKNGDSQAVRLPKEFRFAGDEVLIKRVGSAVVLLPKAKSWDTLIQSLDKFPADFMSSRGNRGRQSSGIHSLEMDARYGHLHRDHQQTSDRAEEVARQVDRTRGYLFHYAGRTCFWSGKERARSGS